MELISKPHQPLAPVTSYLGSFSVAVRKLRMVMQFQGLENPIQISLQHSHRLSGFASDRMSSKPAKGRPLCPLSLCGLSYHVGEIQGYLVRGQNRHSLSKGDPGKPRRLEM